MKVERYEQNARHLYHIRSDYVKDSITMEPQELLQLLVYLQDFEQQIIADSQDNRELEVMLERGYSVEEIKHAREIQKYGGTDITDLVRQKLEESEE